MNNEELKKNLLNLIDLIQKDNLLKMKEANKQIIFLTKFRDYLIAFFVPLLGATIFFYCAIEIVKFIKE